MYFIYQVLKIIVKIALWVYFPGTEVKNRERLLFKGPAIVISNHPNTLMDVLNVAARSREQFYFLANAGLFKSKFGNWFFNTFYCIPIERILDTGGKPLNNASSFERCFERLEKGGTIYIAAEGTSWMERHLHPFKTGTARIALGAESRNDFQLDMKIIPVGLSYSAPTKFRSKVFIKVGEPVYIKDFRQKYEEDEVAAVRYITQVLEAKVRTLIIDTENEAEDELIVKLEKMWQNTQALDAEGQFERTNRAIDNLRIWKKVQNIDFENFKEKVGRYFATLEKYQIQDETVAQASDRGLWWKILLLGLGLPFFLYGVVNHLLPLGIPFAAAWLLIKRIGLYIGYTSTIKISVGVLSVPLFYWLQSEVVQYFFGIGISWWYLISLPVAGWLTLEYRALAKKALSDLRFQNKSYKKDLLEKRISIEQEMEKHAILNNKKVN